MSTLLGYEWTINKLATATLNIYECISPIMIFYITEDARDKINDSKKNEYEKLLYCIYKSNLRGHIPLYFADVEIDKIRIITREDLAKVDIDIAISETPHSIDEIIYWIMECLYLKNKDYGKEIVDIQEFDFYSFDNKEQFEFFVSLLFEKRYLNGNKNYYDNEMRLSFLKFTNTGWEYIEKNINSNINSKKVFIAMSFDKSLDKAYEGIARAINKNGFKDIRIDKKPHNNEISSEIAYEIRQARFIVADVTNQRPGVYFEAGYALGRNIPVIWSCRRDDLGNVHFDTRQYNHVVWENEDDLMNKLADRIKGTIL
jgi:nucleoside 2-deoxyribosyltransferase